MKFKKFIHWYRNTRIFQKPISHPKNSTRRCTKLNCPGFVHLYCITSEILHVSRDPDTMPPHSVHFERTKKQEEKREIWFWNVRWVPSNKKISRRFIALKYGKFCFESSPSILPRHHMRWTKPIIYDLYFIFHCNLNDRRSVLQRPAPSFTLGATTLHTAIYCCLSPVP